MLTMRYEIYARCDMAKKKKTKRNEKGVGGILGNTASAKGL